MPLRTQHPASNQRPRPALPWALLVTIAIDSVGQILWKQVATALPASNEAGVLLTAVLHLERCWMLLALMLLQLLLWLHVLKHSELGRAQAITSLSYVGVAALSVVVLHESFGWRSAASVGLILFGVTLVTWASPPPVAKP